MFKKMSYSTKKFIRSEKARIRRQFFDSKKQEKLIKELYDKILGETPELAKEAEVVDATEVVKEKKETEKTKKARKINKKAEL